jgi:hypothetical protein
MSIVLNSQNITMNVYILLNTFHNKKNWYATSMNATYINDECIHVEYIHRGFELYVSWTLNIFWGLSYLDINLGFFSEFLGAYVNFSWI